MLEPQEHAPMTLAPYNVADSLNALPSPREAGALLGIAHTRIETVAPLTPMQRDLYLDHLISADSASFSIGTVADLGPDVDPEIWRQAVSLVIDQEPILRTIFLTYRGYVCQIVLRDAPSHFAYVDLAETGMEPATDRTSFILTHLIKVRYDLSGTQPALRNVLLKDLNGHYVAVLACHHILCDGFAVKVFMERVGAVYAALVRGQAIDTGAWGSFYACIADIQAQFDTLAVQEYWQQALQPVVPIQPYRETDQARRLSQVEIVQGEELKALREFCQAHKYSLPAYFRSLFCIFLSKYYHTQHDFMLYSLINGRPEAHRNALGCFFHVLPIIVPHDLVADNAHFSEMIDYMRKYRKTNTDKQSISMLLQKRLTKTEPVRFYYNFLNFGTLQFLDREVELDLSVYDYYGFDEVHFVVDDKGDKIELWLYYDQSVFADTLFLERIRALSQQVLKGAHRPGEMQLLLERERQLLAQAAHVVRPGAVGGRTLPELFAAQVRNAPDAIAAAYGDQQVSYAALDQRAQAMAGFLREQGVRPEVLVAILAERHLSFVTAMLGIFKAGGAYLPLNPYYPAKQLAEVLQQSASPLVLVDRAFLPALLRALQEIPVDRQPVVCVLDDVLARLPFYKEQEALVVDLKPDHLAYVIYTSGSTGVPKGVMIEQRSMLNHLFEKVHELQLGTPDRIAQNASQSFDISVWQWLAALIVGGRVQIIADQEAHDPVRLMEQVQRYGVTVLEVVPSLIQGFFLQLEVQEGSQQPSLPHMRWLLSTGEALSPRLANRWLELFPHTPMVNAYGPTECGDDVTHAILEQPLSEERKHTPIGHALANLQLYVLDQRMRLVPPGVPGELYVGGVGVGRGYLHEPLKTAAVFVPDPFHPLPGQRLYRTGDLVRFLPTGELEYLGRTDYQVKVRGFRIELGEIEANLLQHPEIQEAVVVTHQAAAGDTRLIAYIVTRAGGSPTQNELRTWMRKRVAEYAVPSVFVALEHLPLSASGKVDRQALPSPDLASSSEQDAVSSDASSPTEGTLAAIWSQILGIADLGIHDNFFELGGNSLLAIRLSARIRETLGTAIPLRALLSLPTIASQAQYIDEA